MSVHKVRIRGSERGRENEKRGWEGFFLSSSPVARNFDPLHI
jgi:hypothetical protein